jgi:hypothetical protein
MKNFIKKLLRESYDKYGDDYDFSKHNFNFGDCDVYAVSLHRLYGYPLYVVRGWFLEPEWGGKREWDYEDCHIMVKLPNGKYIDSNGEFTGKEMKQSCLFDNEVKRITIVPIDEETALSTFSCEHQEDDIQKVMSYIKSKNLNEQLIDGQEMNKTMESICDKMTINSYEEAMTYVNGALQDMDEQSRHKVMKVIHTPLENLKHQQSQINGEIKKQNMSGDSMPDQADTYWHQIQSTLCEMGSDFQ